MIIQLLSGPVSGQTTSTESDDLAQINSLANPPLTTLQEHEIHVRRCRLAGDAMDAHFGCFRSHELERLLKLTHGAPALVGHNRSSLAVARFFGGSVEEFAGHHYIVPKFYWPKAHSGAEDFRVLLDTGIINEASIAFTFEQPSCSVCGKDIRECEHEPGTMYGLRMCHYFYDGVDKVLEGSFVYRGAQPNTGIVSEISAPFGVAKKQKSVKVILNGRVYEAMAPMTL